LFAGLLALHPANIFAPPKILDKKAAQGHALVYPTKEEAQSQQADSAIPLLGTSPYLRFAFWV